jgi:chaperonin GroEL
VRARMRQIEVGIEAETNGFERGKLQTRLNRLCSGVAALHIGAPTEVELKEMVGRAENALQACRAAAEEGVVAGGGVALLNAVPAVENLALEGDEAFGAALVQRALSAPLRQLARNGGFDPTLTPAEVLRSQTAAGCSTVGLDVVSGMYCDLLGAGIADPLKLVRRALDSATSVAAMALSNEALVTESRLGQWREELRKARRPKPWPGVSGEAFQSPPPIQMDGR